MKTKVAIQAERVRADLVIRDAEAGAIRISAAEAAGEKGTAELHRFTMTAYTGGKLDVGLGLPVVVDLSGLRVSAKSRPILFAHDPARPLGHTTEIQVNDGGIRASGVFSGSSDVVGEVIGSSSNGFPWQASIGATADRMVHVDRGESVQVNGRTFAGPLYVARRSTLKEISVVALGADDNTTTKLAANAGGNQTEILTMKFEEWLKANGHDANQLDESKLAQLKAQFQAEQQEPDSKEPPSPTAVQAQDGGRDPIAEHREKIAAELERVAQIQAISGIPPKVAATAVREGWTVEKAELETLRASRPQAPHAHTGHGEAVGGEVLEAAVCLSAGLAEAEKQYGEKVLNAAHKRFKGRIGLQELLVEAAQANGYHGWSFDRDPHGVMRAAFGAGIQAASGFSTFSLPGILSNIANKFLLQGFNAVEDTWRQIAAVRSVRDFKRVTSYRLTGDFEYEQLGPTGEIKHGQVGEEEFGNQADTYAKMFAITRKDLINDDLNALTVIPQRIGRGAALKLNKVFWSEFLAGHDTFFTTARGNYQAGADTALGIDALTAAELLFLDQKDPDGNPLGVSPALMLVPNALNVKGSQVANNTEVREDGNTSRRQYTTTNPHAGKFRVVRSSYLNMPAVPNGSDKAWYLLASPADLPLIEVAFLNGRDAPTVETADADFNTLGIQMRGYHDFGVEKQDHRAGVKMLGEAE